MKNIIVKILLIVAAISFPYKAIAQDLTEEETTFLKSLSGKWSDAENRDKPFGTFPLDLTIRYFNGSLKITYPYGIFIDGGDRSLVKSKTLNAFYDKSANSVSFDYECRFLFSDDDEPMDVHKYVSIPFQTDIEDIIIINSKTVYDNGGVITEEKMLYKQ